MGDSFSELVQKLDVDFNKVSRAFRITEAKVYKRRYTLKEAYLDTCKELKLTKHERRDLYEGLLERYNPPAAATPKQPSTLDRFLTQLGDKLWENLHQVGVHAEAASNPMYRRVLETVIDHEDAGGKALTAVQIFEQLYESSAKKNIKVFEDMLRHMVGLKMLSSGTRSGKHFFAHSPEALRETIEDKASALKKLNSILAQAGCQTVKLDSPKDHILGTVTERLEDLWYAMEEDPEPEDKESVEDKIRAVWHCLKVLFPMHLVWFKREIENDIGDKVSKYLGESKEYAKPQPDGLFGETDEEKLGYLLDVPDLNPKSVVKELKKSVAELKKGGLAAEMASNDIRTAIALIKKVYPMHLAWILKQARVPESIFESEEFPGEPPFLGNLEDEKPNPFPADAQVWFQQLPAKAMELMNGGVDFGQALHTLAQEFVGKTDPQRELDNLQFATDLGAQAAQQVGMGPETCGACQEPEVGQTIGWQDMAGDVGHGSVVEIGPDSVVVDLPSGDKVQVDFFDTVEPSDAEDLRQTGSQVMTVPEYDIVPAPMSGCLPESLEEAYSIWQKTRRSLYENRTVRRFRSYVGRSTSWTPKTNISGRVAARIHWGA